MTDRVPTAADVDTETDCRFDRKMTKAEQAEHDEACARIRRIKAKVEAELMLLHTLPTTGHPY